jgi:hypothetical protein
MGYWGTAELGYCGTEVLRNWGTGVLRCRGVGVWGIEKGVEFCGGFPRFNRYR